ncbi:hypothetical protein PybrP1_000391 [[Pythium] brassicae (nom. inval.)]|nr:hypothetical protein PybrP1_000391 [[Pythium] brassicae (nom. inval.)]
MGNKRRMGHIGFQSSEIAFIEDEMAAIAAEYGLEIDADVAQHVHQRQDAKKARRKKPLQQLGAKAGAGRSSNSDAAPPKRKRVALHSLPSRFRHDTPLADVNEHGEVLDVLRDVLPEGGALAQCGVPGCSCRHGGREMVLDAHAKKEHHSMATLDALRAGQCKRCQHGVLQHAVVVRDDGSDGAAKPSGGQRLFAALYRLIRLARLAGTVYGSRVWSASATELLEALLLHMKALFASGGTQNGQKTAAELQREQQVVAELQAQLAKAARATGTSARDDMPILLACVYDQMYFQCYYASIVLYGRACGAVPPPDAYLRDLEHFCPDAQSQLEAFVNNELVGGGGDDDDSDIPSSLVDALALPVRASKKPVDAPALLEIFHARLREGVRLFYEQGVGMHGEMDALLANPHLIASAQAAVASKKKPQKKHYRRERGKAAAPSSGAGERTSSSAAGVTTNNNGLVELPAFALLAQWRNNCRDWCCHLYAYATPTSAALGVVGEYAPLVEMGAGTGYWSSLLQQRNVDIVAYDKCPPTTDGATDTATALPGGGGGRARRQERNAYHGQAPPFCAIGKGGPEVLAQTGGDMAARNLLLCYPPPHDDMALNCVRLFQGEFIVHVGEWQGDTGDRRFEKELQLRFALVRELTLPNWGNSAYHLSVWRRKRPGGAAPFKQVPCAALSCFTCRKSLEDAADEGEALRRCVLCKTNAYCSAFCEERGRKAHAAEHAKRLIFLENEDDLEFANELHYAPLVAVAELDTEEADRVVKVQKSWKEVTGAGHGDDDTGDSDGDSDSINDEGDAAHASDEDDSDMQDSDIDDEDSDEPSGDDDDDDAMNDDDSEPEQLRAPPAKKPRQSEKKPAALQPKPKTTGFAFNFKA